MSKIVIVDIDGTLANSDGIRSPYDESRVSEDKVYPVIQKWVQELNRYYRIIIVTGRHYRCYYDTRDWLRKYELPWSPILMRATGDQRPDQIVKFELLQAIYKQGYTKDDIAFVLDDRPKVIRMWKEQGLTVYPVRGAIKEF